MKRLLPLCYLLAWGLLYAVSPGPALACLCRPGNGVPDGFPLWAVALLLFWTLLYWR